MESISALRLGAFSLRFTLHRITHPYTHDIWIFSSVVKSEHVVEAEVTSTAAWKELKNLGKLERVLVLIDKNVA